MEDTTSILPGAAPARYEARLLRSLVFILLLLSAGRSDAQPALSAPSAANHRLVGTVEGGIFSGAVWLMDPSGEQHFFRLNEMLPDGSRLVTLRSDSILIKRQDGMTYEVFVFRELRSATPSSPAQVPGPVGSHVEEVPKTRRAPATKHPPRSSRRSDVDD